MRAQLQLDRRCCFDGREIFVLTLAHLSLSLPSFPPSSRTFARCAGCRFEFTLRMPDRPASAAAAAAGAAAAGPTAAEWVRLIPINAELMDSIHRGRLLERVVSETQRQLQGHGGASRCTYPQCSQPALFWCEECEGELCAAHDRDLHPKAAAAAAAAASSSSAEHRRTPISERAAARQAKMAVRLAANGARLRASFLSSKMACAESHSALAVQLAEEIARHEREVLVPMRAELAASSNRLAALESISEDILHLSDTDLLRHEARMAAAMRTGVALEGLLAALSAERRSDLERFLQTAGVSLVSRQCG